MKDTMSKIGQYIGIGICAALAACIKQRADERRMDATARDIAARVDRYKAEEDAANENPEE